MGPTPLASAAAIVAIGTVAAVLASRARRTLPPGHPDGRGLAAMVEHADSPMALIDGERRIEWANPAFYRLVQRSAAELAGTVIGVLAAPRADAALLKAVREEMHVGHGVAFESWLPTAAGVDRWVRVNCQPVEMAGGAVEEWVVILSDLTASRDAEASLAARARRLEAAIAAGGVGLWEVEPGGEVWLDVTARRLLGLAAGQDRFAVAALASAPTPAGRPRESGGLAAALARGGDIDERVVRVGEDGRERRLQVVGRARHDADGRIRATGVLCAEAGSLHPTVNTG